MNLNLPMPVRILVIDDDKDYEKKLSKMARAGFSYEISKEILK